MTKLKDMHQKWMQTDSTYKAEYNALEEEFGIIRAVVSARIKASLTQKELAERMKTSQSAIARMESGAVIPNHKTLKKLASATNTRLHIEFI